MRKLLLVLAGLTAAALSLYSQNVDSLLRADYSRMGANYHCYEAPTEPLAAAPEGFAPFYVSHYGRHGSRFITFDSSHEYVISQLKQLRDAGLLNEWGDELLSSLSFCWSQMEPRLGRLAPKGVQEHEGIAARMYTRFPEVFGPGASVRAVSSTSRRCKASMTAFLGSLLRYESSLDLSTDASQENMAYISNHGKMPHKQAVRDLLDSLQNATLCPLDVIAPLVTDSKAAMALLRHPVRFERALYDCVAIDQCLPFSAGLLSFIPYEEGCKLWSLKNKQQYLYHGNSIEYGDLRIPASRPLAEDIVSKADKAVAAGKKARAADLRFGHDSALTALECLIGVEGFDERLSASQTDRWQNFKRMCMGSNLQLIFYRNAGGDVLVRVLQNERDADVPALGKGPFYPWTYLRAHILSRCSD